MTDRERRIVTNRDLLDGIFDTDFEKEQSFRSTRTLILDTYVTDSLAGTLKALFRIEREVDYSQDIFTEKDKSVKLGDVEVEPLYRRQGIASAMITELEKVAKRFGASKIEGIITAKDYAEQHWLPDFYKGLGFAVEAKGAGFTIVKTLFLW